MARAIKAARPDGWKDPLRNRGLRRRSGSREKSTATRRKRTKRMRKGIKEVANDSSNHRSSQLLMARSKHKPRTLN